MFEREENCHCDLRFGNLLQKKTKLYCHIDNKKA
jgi:hypothetical protein